jgi:hypothetical protein
MKKAICLLVSPLILTFAILSVVGVHADVGVDLHMVHAYDFYYATIELTADTPTPITYHRVESPSGTIWQHAGSNEDGNNGGDTLTNNLAALVYECTNGLWALTLNVGDASEEQYTFSVAMDGVDTNLFGDIVVSAPTAYSTVTNNPPIFEWTGPSHLPELEVSVFDTGFTMSDWAMLPSNTTSWTPSITLAAGDNRFYPHYTSNNFAGISFTTPNNGAFDLPDWSATSDVRTYAVHTFSITNTATPPAASALGNAVDAPYLTWTTGGEADWFFQTLETTDGIDAAQSGSIGLYESSWIETTVTSDGVMQFWLKIDADESDYFEVTVNDSYEYDLWEYSNWEPYELYLYAGDAVRWTFYNDDDTGGSQDAAFLDRVEFSDNPLALAVDAPELVWTTGGDADWFEQDFETMDGVDAAQSGPIGEFQHSWIATEAVGPGTLSFWWGAFASPFDFMDFELNNSSEGFLNGDFGWDWLEVDLEPGTNTLRWTYFKDFGGGLYDAGFLDQVVYTPQATITDYEADFYMSIRHNSQGMVFNYAVHPYFGDYAPTSATIEVESYNGLVSGQQWSSTSPPFGTLQDAIDECVAGPWTIYFNRGESDEKQFTFEVFIPTLLAEGIPPVAILSPEHDAFDVSPNPEYLWIGPSVYSYISAQLYDLENYSTVAYQTLLVTDLEWTTAPAAPEGTNRFSITYTLNDYPGIILSDPEDDNGDPLANWGYSTTLATRDQSVFAVGGFIPFPVTILPPVFLGGDLGLSFLTQSGATHFVEWTTNLVTGPWLPATNFPGDGTTNMFSLPATNPAAFFRVNSL